MSIIKIEGLEFLITKGLVRTIALRDDLIDDIGNPDIIVDKLKNNHVPADILVFSQHLPDLSPMFSYPMEWDNIAALPITSYEHWLSKQVHQSTRNKIKRAQNNNVEVTIECLSRRVAEGLVGIFNETAVRRGKKYSYYGRDVEMVEKEWSRDSSRSDLLIAYYKNEIIGFIQLVYAEKYARTSGTIAKLSHRDKATMNALFAKAVEVCAEKKIPYLIYGKFAYGNKGEDSLTAFKKNNGFQKFDVPKYIIPLTLRGEIGFRLKLHHGFTAYLPSNALKMLTQLRNNLYNRFYNR